MLCSAGTARSNIAEKFCWVLEGGGKAERAREAKWPFWIEFLLVFFPPSHT